MPDMKEMMSQALAAGKDLDAHKDKGNELIVKSNSVIQQGQEAEKRVAISRALTLTERNKVSQEKEANEILDEVFDHKFSVDSGVFEKARPHFFKYKVNSGRLDGGEVVRRLAKDYYHGNGWSLCCGPIAEGDNYSAFEAALASSFFISQGDKRRFINPEMRKSKEAETDLIGATTEEVLKSCLKDHLVTKREESLGEVVAKSAKDEYERSKSQAKQVRRGFV